MCTMGEAAKEILSHCAAIAPLKASGKGALTRQKLVVVGLGGPAGAGKSTLAEWLRRDGDALVLPLEQYARRDQAVVQAAGLELSDHPSSLDVDAVKKAVNELRNEFRTVLPVPDIERNIAAEANLEKLRQKLYAGVFLPLPPSPLPP